MASNRHEYADRAKQFAPFDALKGFREALAEREKIRVPRIQLSEDQKERLDWQFQFIKPGDMITVVYFYEDEYIKTTGLVAKIDEYEKTITIVKNKISIQDVYEIEADTQLVSFI